ncbi:MAG TPA: Com family DNA-binding transcriptional regulator [Gaiellaceae bacterium]|nr:Com family DNA-binding transcriptional regulator [Gaiellaceae bacterium]
MGNVRITWNDSAIEQFRQRAIGNAFDQLTTKCPKCGTSPRVRQYGRYFCECGYLEGVVTERTGTAHDGEAE